MRQSLSFVKGAVARKDFLPVLTHFSLNEGRITGYNGTIALSSPVPLDFCANPNAQQLHAAINTCEGPMSIVALPNGDLSVSTSTFDAVVECSPEIFPDIPIGGDRLDMPYPLLPALKLLVDFISEDDSRKWSRGVLLRGQSAVATTNVVLVEYWTGASVPVEIIIPKPAVDEMLRIAAEPEYLEVRQGVGITVRYANGRWLFARAIDDVWPEYTRYFGPSEPGAFPSTFFKSVASLSPFLSKERSVYLYSGKATTLPSESGKGASAKIPELDVEAKFNWDQLTALSQVATHIDWKVKPAATFFGDRLRGVILAMRA